MRRLSLAILGIFSVSFGQELPNACPLPEGVVGEAYSHQMRATGFTAAPRWLPTGLPEGLSQNADTGLITGIPVRAGNHLVTVFASGFQNSQLAVAICTMQVRAGVAVSSLSVATASPLPDASAFAEYTAKLEAEGGRPPLTWSPVVGSALPPGLVLAADGRIAGKATAPGDYSFRVRLSDSAGQQYETTLALRVGALPAFDVSVSAVALTAPAGGTAPPPVPVEITSVVPQPFRTVTSTKNGGGWLKATPGEGQAPAAFAIEADPSGLAAGRYEGAVEVAGEGAAARVIGVSLEVANPMDAAKLAVDLPEVAFQLAPDAAPVTRTVRVLNTGGGVVAFRAELRTVSSGAWIKVTPESGTASATEPSVLTLEITPGVLPRDLDFASALLDIRADDGQAVSVPVLLALARDEAPVSIVPPRVFFPLLAGAPAFAQTLSLRNDGREPLEFNTTLIAPNFGAAPARGMIQPGTVVDLQVGTRENVAATPGLFSATLGIGFGRNLEAVRVPVGAEINALGRSTAPVLSANALTLKPEGAARTAMEELRLQNPGSQAVVYQIAAASPGNWLSVEPQRVNLEPGGVGRIRVTATAGNLASGGARGTVTLQAAGGVSRSVPVLFFAPGNCTPSGAALQMRALAGNVTPNAAYPIAMEVGAYDNCGNPLRSGSVMVTLSNGDPAIALSSLRDGRWAGEWVVRNVPADRQVAWIVTASSGGLTTTQSGAIRLQDGPVPPAVLGTLDAASLQEDRPIAPGGVFTILGARLADRAVQSPLTQWPRQLAGVEVLLQDRPLPIYSASAERLVVQAPFTLRAGQRVELSVRRAGLTSVPLTVKTSAAAPSILLAEQPAAGSLGRFFDSEGNAITAANPAVAGSTVLLYATGLGKVQAAAENGAAPVEAVALSNPVFVRVNSQEARVTGAALATVAVGLYRVLFVVPDIAPDSAEATVVVAVAGQISQPVTLPVRAR